MLGGRGWETSPCVVLVPAKTPVSHLEGAPWMTNFCFAPLIWELALHPGLVDLGSGPQITNLWIALHSLHSIFPSALSFWQAFLNGNTLLKLNLKISMAVSLQNYVLRMFSVATMERELDTERRNMGVLVPAQRLIGFDQMISEGHPGLTSYISEAPDELLLPRSLRR